MKKRNKKGLGVDIIEIERFLKALNHHKDKILKRLFTEREINYCSKYRNSEIHFAGKFAAKEAIAKALGPGFGEKISFLDIEVGNDDTKKPYVTLSKKILKNFKNPKILISISHSKNFAVATALVEY
jgi:holo-[acyl-carrier protein] synthase